MYRIQSEWDIGLEDIVFKSLKKAKQAAKTALSDAGIEDDIKELEEEGLIDYIKLEVR